MAKPARFCKCPPSGLKLYSNSTCHELVLFDGSGDLKRFQIFCRYWHILFGHFFIVMSMRGYHDTEKFRMLRYQLVNSIREKGITDERVLAAIRSIPRQFFMPVELLGVSYIDKAFPIGEGQTISQPYTVSYQTQLLDVHPTHRVLEIGTGSAYQAVILAILAAEVFTIERQKKLFERNREFHYLNEFPNLYFFYGDGYEGLPDLAPFDRILLTAAAPVIPPKLVDQLKPGGRMVLPLGADKPQRMVRLTKDEHDEISEEYFADFLFVPMLYGKKE